MIFIWFRVLEFGHTDTHARTMSRSKWSNKCSWFCTSAETHCLTASLAHWHTVDSIRRKVFSQLDQISRMTVCIRGSTTGWGLFWRRYNDQRPVDHYPSAFKIASSKMFSNEIQSIWRGYSATHTKHQTGEVNEAHCCIHKIWIFCI